MYSRRAQKLIIEKSIRWWRCYKPEYASFPILHPTLSPSRTVKEQRGKWTETEFAKPGLFSLCQALQQCLKVSVFLTALSLSFDAVLLEITIAKRATGSSFRLLQLISETQWSPRPKIGWFTTQARAKARAKCLNSMLKKISYIGCETLICSVFSAYPSTYYSTMRCEDAAEGTSLPLYKHEESFAKHQTSLRVYLGMSAHKKVSREKRRASSPHCVQHPQQQYPKNSKHTRGDRIQCSSNVVQFYEWSFRPLAIPYTNIQGRYYFNAWTSHLYSFKRYREKTPVSDPMQKWGSTSSFKSLIWAALHVIYGSTSNLQFGVWVLSALL